MRTDIGGWQVRLSEAEVRARRAAGEWSGRTLADEARAVAAKNPDGIALRCGAEVLTFGEALAGAERLAAGLWRIGLRPGDVLSFQLPNWLEAVTLDLACVLLGVVVNPIVPIYRNAEVGLILRDCRAKAVVVPDTYRGFDFAGMIEALRPDLPDLRHLIVARSASPRSGAIAFADLARDGGFLPWPTQRADAVKMIMYTSGTTGRPKGALHAHETFPRALRQSLAFWNIAPPDSILMASPVTHATGFSFGMECPFQTGIPTLLMERWDPDEAVGLVDTHGATLTVGATPFLADLVTAAERAGSRLPSLKVFACGGAAVPPAVIRRANTVFAHGRAFRVYGSTEAPMITLGFVSPGTEDLAAETDGRIVDYEVRIVDEAGVAVPDGREGEILARGPALFAGYADTAETAAAFTADGFFRMGDIGFRTPDRAIVITGRKKDLIIRGGENISAKEIEDALHAHPAVREAAIVAMPHPRLVETVCAYVIPAEGSVPTLADLARHLEDVGLARQKIPERLELVDELPRTASGKIKKDVLRARVAAALAARAIS